MRTIFAAVSLLTAACVSHAPAPNGPPRLQAMQAPQLSGFGPWWRAAQPCGADGTLRGGPPPQAHEVWCENAEGLRHGPYTWWDGMGFKIAEGQYLHGRPDGEWLAWHANGTVKLRASYRDGAAHGAWFAFYDNGSISTELRFVNGVKHGPWAWWYASGAQAGSGTFYEDRPEGRWVRWDRDGTLIRLERYERDELVTSYTAQLMR